MQRFKSDVILAEQIFVLTQALYELFLGEPAATLALHLSARNAPRTRPLTVYAREFAIALHFPALALHTGEDALRF